MEPQNGFFPFDLGRWHEVSIIMGDAGESVVATW